MKTSSIFLSSLLAVTSSFAWASSAAPQQSTDGRVSVSFFEPEKFRDVGRTYNASDRDREADLSEIREYLVRQASHYLPEGYRLEVTFNDIDMAGEFEPQRGPRWTDVRVIKDIYAPRMALSFRLTDADGNIVKEGKRNLTDLAFLSKLVVDRNDAYRHEKALLDDWLRSEFPRQPKL